MSTRFPWVCLIALACLLSTCGLGSDSHSTEPTGPQIILKLDDLAYQSGLIHPGWIEVMDFLNEEEVIGTIGLIGKSLENASDDYHDWILDRHKEGHEIWNHGYCHCKPEVDGHEVREFQGTSYAYQLDQLTRTQQLAQEKLGLTLRTFGAPYNAVDSLTAQALSTIPELQIWLYKHTDAPTDKFLLNRIAEVNIEYPVHIPDFEQFKEGYRQFQDAPVLIIQGHPRSWVNEPDRMETFKQIIRFLKSEGVQFTTPWAYFQAQ
ncbi:polysaccharide deacetylase family protein [Pontibacter sp. G13]|uniref:polysaccharide deacetylase family protein n=1 Tax=Pontibacter sp. G13 TaxID=3074898 RepID=UPI00288BB7F1|nr:polysaccharide deacetylase family protein [Pontibacter sp. G13]WNJ17105.1 polysaccharide deacetylase family protein [Pontibacter sp. G13]